MAGRYLAVLNRELRLIARVLLALAAAITVMLTFAAAPLSAAPQTDRPYLESFGPDGTSATRFQKPAAIAVDQASRDIYVADLEAQAVFKFDENHQPADFSTLGSNKLGGFSFSAAEPGVSELAVDSGSHDIYVADIGADAVKAFHADGEPAEFSAVGASELTGFTEVCGVAVDAVGDIYVGDFSSVSVFTATGELLTSFPANEACNLAVDSAGAVYVDYYALIGNGRVEKFVPSQFPVTASTTYSSAGTVDPGPAFGVAVEPAASGVYVDRQSGIIHYDGAAEQVGTFGFSGEGALTESQGVAVLGSGGDAYASDGGSGRVKVFGPPEARKPSIDSVSVSGVTSTEATIDVRINPEGSETSFQVEFGSQECSTGTCATTAPIGLGSSAADQAASVTLTGLAPASTYHFRVVATSSAGSTLGADRTFTTFPVGSGALPDGRAYEKVSPLEKNGGDAGLPGSDEKTGGAHGFTARPQQASPSGQALAFASFAAFGEDLQSAPGTSEYLARRGPDGWSTENINPRFEEGFLRDPWVGFSNDLSHGTAIVIEPALTGDATVGYPNIYRRDNVAGSLTALTTEAHRPQISIEKRFYCLSLGGASADYGRVIFAAKGALNEGDPVANGFNLYEWSAAEGLRLASVLPADARSPGPAEPTPAPATGHGGSPGCDASGATLRHAVSADGSRIFWTGTTYEKASGEFAVEPLLARVDGSETVQLDARQGITASFSGEGVYADASVDGSKVFFTDPLELTSGSSGSTDLYRYDFEKAEGSRLEDLTGGGVAAGVQGVVGASDDGSFVYFVATGVLDTAPNSRGETAASGGDNLYVWHEGEGVSFIAGLGAGAVSDWAAAPDEQTARVTPDGRHLAFLSKRSLTGYPNSISGQPGCEFNEEIGYHGSPDCAEAFLFDFAGGEIHCVSCSPSGAEPIGPAALPTWSSPYQQPRYVSDDGNRVFFETLDSLSPQDTNRRIDVYEFERPGTGDCNSADPTFSGTAGGCISLLSTGRSDSASYFVDASVSGDDAFISTRQSLVYTDSDSLYDVYDARVGGSGPPPPPAPPCRGEACRGPASVPTPPSAAATTVVRPGNPPRTCGKRSRRVVKHGKVRCVPRRHPRRGHSAHHHGGHRRGHRHAARSVR